MCEHIYEQKQACERIIHEVDMAYLKHLQELSQDDGKRKEEKRLVPKCDARAYADYHSSGGSDAGGRARG